MMKRRLLARRKGPVVGRATIQQHVPWYGRVGLLVALILLAAGGSVWIYDSIMSQVQGDVRSALSHNEDMAKEIVTLRAERDALVSSTNAADSKIRMAESARESLERQLKDLEKDNAKLKADLAFFEGLLPSDQANGLTVPRLTAERVANGAVLQVRAMVAQGNARSDKEFNGRVQLSLITVQGEKTGTTVFPTESMPPAEWALKFRRYQRLELNVPLAAGMQVRSVELRVLDQGGAIRARHSAQI